MAKRQTIGDNPLDAYISPNVVNGGVEVLENEAIPKKPKQSKTTHYCPNLRRCHRAYQKRSVLTPGLTLASLAEDAFSKAVDALENKREAPFPKRKEELKTGRPIN